MGHVLSRNKHLQTDIWCHLLKQPQPSPFSGWPSLYLFVTSGQCCTLLMLCWSKGGFHWLVGPLTSTISQGQVPCPQQWHLGTTHIRGSKADCLQHAVCFQCRRHTEVCYCYEAFSPNNELIPFLWMAFKNEIGSPFANMKAEETIYSFVQGFGQPHLAAIRARRCFQ